MNTFKNRDFLKLLDFTPAEIEALLNLSAALKKKKRLNGNAAHYSPSLHLALVNMVAISVSV